MQKLQNNFTLQEFACKCGCGKESQHLIQLDQLSGQLQKIRDIVGMPIIINSGFRCVSHNSRVGGASRSLHISGCAADIRIDGISPRVLFLGLQFLMEAGVILKGGLKAYNTFVHYDIRGSVTYF